MESNHAHYKGTPPKMKVPVVGFYIKPKRILRRSILSILLQLQLHACTLIAIFRCPKQIRLLDKSVQKYLVLIAIVATKSQLAPTYQRHGSRLGLQKHEW
jgi:hypothetical protein